MKATFKMLFVLAGYVLAWLGATFLTELYDARLTASDPNNASGGMAAFGVMSAFVMAFTALAFVPTALGIWFLRSSPQGWGVGVRIARWVTGSGVAAVIILVPLLILNRMKALATNPVLEISMLLVGIRIVGAPVIGFLDLTALVIAPESESRSKLLRLLKMEMAVFVGGVALYLVWPHR